MIILWVRWGEEGKGWAKNEKERNLKIAKWIILNDYSPEKNNRTPVYCFGYSSVFFRGTCICTNYTGLYILLYTCFFLKKSNNVVFSVERTHQKNCEYWSLLTYLLNLSWNWAQFYTESCGFQYVIPFVFGWKRGHELENSMRRECSP